MHSLCHGSDREGQWIKDKKVVSIVQSSAMLHFGESVTVITILAEDESLI